MIPPILIPAPKRGVWPPGGRPQGHLLARGRDAGTNTSVSTPSTTSSQTHRFSTLLSLERERYTEQVLHPSSCGIVDLATDLAPAVIALEELTGYRETAAEPIHDWPFALLQEMIAYKAKAAGILVEMVNPAYTNVTCRQCSQTNREYRDGTEFHCTRCGYEVHADVNAAINLAMRWLKE